MEKLIVRSPTEEDFLQWKELWLGYNAFYGRSGMTALSRRIIELTWARFLDDREPIHALVATRANELLGLAHFLFHRSTTHVAEVCYLQDLFTVEKARGQGVGKKLIHAVFDRARTAGSCHVFWRTDEKNTHAIRLYDALAERQPVAVYRKLL